MSEMNQNYSEERKKKKGLVLILILCLALLFIGIAAAYFSGVFFRGGNINTSTLTLNGQYTFYLNGEETELAAITNLYPGDVVVVKGTVSNTGSQSAWIRDEILVSAPELADYIEIYSGEFTQEDFVGQTDLSDSLLAFSDGRAVSATRIINSATTNARNEVPEGVVEEYDFIDNDQYALTFTIYFQHAAGNEAQGKTVNFTVGAKALQFVNNNTAIPNETAWAAIEFVSP